MILVAALAEVASHTLPTLPAIFGAELKTGMEEAFFFLFIHYSYATYGDHGENMYSPFPVRCPRSGGSLQAPLLPSAQACPENLWRAPRKLQRKEGEKSDCVGPRKTNEGENTALRLSRACG